jgi:hypothetical protein
MAQGCLQASRIKRAIVWERLYPEAWNLELLPQLELRTARAGRAQALVDYEVGVSDAYQRVQFWSSEIERLKELASS